MSATLLPPNATRAERAIEGATARIEDVPIPIRSMWDPATCPAFMLPWLAWGLSIDLWDTDWSEPAKRAAVALAIGDQRRKGTRASLREVLDRFDPLIGLVEWFEDRGTLAPHTFRLELPLGADSAVDYDETLVAALLRDIGAIKPLRSHMFAVHRMIAQTELYVSAAAQAAGFGRYEGELDLEAPADPSWANYLQTEDGEPLRGGDGEFLETA